MMELGAACLRFEGQSCRTIVDTMVQWAAADAGKMDSCCDTGLFWEESIATNLDLVRPFIGAYAIASATVPVSAADDARIRDWMWKILGRSKNLLRGVRRSGHNYAAHNHAIASAAARMAYGAMWDDADAFGDGLDQWFITLGDMRADGSFPIETRRGQKAMFYTGRVLSGLMSIAEMARAQGTDLYSRAPSQDKTIHKAVGFMVAALDRNEVIYPYAKENIYPGSSRNWRVQHLGSLGSTLGWMIPYTARFPGHPNTIRLEALRTDDEADNGGSVDFVLRSGTAVKGHWTGARSDCLYRVSR